MKNLDISQGCMVGHPSAKAGPRDKAQRRRDKAAAALDEFLESIRTEPGAPFNLTSIEPPGTYYLPADDDGLFWDLYAALVERGGRTTLLERAPYFAPFRVDVDLRWPEEAADETPDRRYGPELVDTVARICRQEIQAVLPPEHDARCLSAVVLEKPAPRLERVKGAGGKRGKKLKDGFHLHFPFFVCRESLPREHLYGAIGRRLEEERVFEALACENAGSELDRGIAGNAWLLYGASKALDAEPYLATRFLDAAGAEAGPEAFYEEELGAGATDVWGRLPFLLSVRGHAAPTRVEWAAAAPEPAKKAAAPKQRTEDEVWREIELLGSSGIVDMLSAARSDDRRQWLEVGHALYDVCEGDRAGLDLWLPFSQRSPKFHEGECEELWDGFALGGKTLGSLIYMARLDSPEAYQAWKRQDVENAVDLSIFEEKKPKEGDIAGVFYALYKDRFVCADAGAKTEKWYEFREHRWRAFDGHIQIRKLIKTAVRQLYIERKAKYEDDKFKLRQQIASQRREPSPPELDREEWLEECRKRCDGVRTALKEDLFLRRVVSMAKTDFYDDSFAKLADENKLLFCCENGVLDLETRTFREGRPSDYCTLSCGQEYREFSAADEELADLNDFLAKVFRDPEIRDYWLYLISNMLEGGNVHKTFLINTGEADGGKTTCFNIVEETFGEYHVKIPRALLAAGKDAASNAPRPELARVRGRRIAIAQELTKEQRFDIGMIKEITGNDSFFARSLYKDGGDIKPMFTLALQCNTIPKMPVNDDATFDRFVMILFDSKFVKEKYLKLNPVPETAEEQFAKGVFRADPHFGNKIKGLAPAMLYLLFQTYLGHKAAGHDVLPPAKVELASAEYRKQNDTFMDYLATRVETDIANDSDASAWRATSAELYEDFIDWTGKNYRGYKMDTTAQEFREILTKFFKRAPEGPKNSLGWKGVRVRVDDERRSLFANHPRAVGANANE